MDGALWRQAALEEDELPHGNSREFLFLGLVEKCGHLAGGRKLETRQCDVGGERPLLLRDAA